MKKISVLFVLLFFLGCASKEVQRPLNYKEPTIMESTVDITKKIGKNTFDALKFFANGGLFEVLK